MSHKNAKFWWMQSKVKLVLLIFLPDLESKNQRVHEPLMAVQTVDAYWERL